ncbi:hypothetical protein N1851_033350 [Merluccius polli]|uniref:Uncharacterized protein n=1 Tax=Merluccius polli TaxID=89951 RepID=A0AA47M1K0_MERPO|nr:hypothetical protein N1851_033350 [Merluccius polli]
MLRELSMTKTKSSGTPLQGFPAEIPELIGGQVLSSVSQSVQQSRSTAAQQAGHSEQQGPHPDRRPLGGHSPGENQTLERTRPWREPDPGENQTLERTRPWREPDPGGNQTLDTLITSQPDPGDPHRPLGDTVLVRTRPWREPDPGENQTLERTRPGDPHTQGPSGPSALTFKYTDRTTSETTHWWSPPTGGLTGLWVTSGIGFRNGKWEECDDGPENHSLCGRHIHILIHILIHPHPHPSSSIHIHIHPHPHPSIHIHPSTSIHIHPSTSTSIHPLFTADLRHVALQDIPESLSPPSPPPPTQRSASCSTLQTSSTTGRLQVYSVRKLEVFYISCLGEEETARNPHLVERTCTRTGSFWVNWKNTSGSSYIKTALQGEDTDLESVSAASLLRTDPSGARRVLVVSAAAYSMCGLQGGNGERHQAAEPQHNNTTTQQHNTPVARCWATATPAGEAIKYTLAGVHLLHTDCSPVMRRVLVLLVLLVVLVVLVLLVLLVVLVLLVFLVLLVLLVVLVLLEVLVVLVVERWGPYHWELR